MHPALPACGGLQVKLQMVDGRTLKELVVGDPVVGGRLTGNVYYTGRQAGHKGTYTYLWV